MGYNGTQQFFLGDLYDISSGISKNKEQFGSGYPFLSFKTVFNYTIIPTDLKDLAQTTLSEQNKYSILYGDVFLTRTSETANELGMSSVALKDYPQATFNGFTKRLRPKKGVMEFIDPKFIAYYLRSKDFRNQIDSISVLTTRASLNQGMIEKLTITVPNIETQKKIAAILSALDEKIATNRAINDNLQQQAVLLFKKWFIEFDNSSKNMLETRFGLVPESFKLLKNGELPLVVTDYVANGSFASLKANVTLYQEPNYAYFIRNTDLKSGTFEVFVDEHSYNFLSKSTLYGGEIIISNVGDVGSVFLCPKLDKPMTLGNNIIMLRPEQENLRYYLYIWFKWLYGQSLIQGIKGGSAQPKFNKTDFKNLPIFLPPDDLLEQFHQIVKPMFELINENNTENQALTRSRETILPRLMSGELDVSDIEI